MNLGLILIDMQNDYFSGGSFELHQSEQAAIQAKKVLLYFRRNQFPVIHVTHINTKIGATFFLPDTIGVNIYKSVLPINGEIQIIKHTPDSFYQTELQEEIDNHKIEHLIVCGMMTHMCVDTTVRAARNFGHSVTLIEDACATKDLVWNSVTVKAPIVQATFLAALNGSFAEVMSADKWLTQVR